jgi:hypothetical protein
MKKLIILMAVLMVTLFTFSAVIPADVFDTDIITANSQISTTDTATPINLKGYQYGLMSLVITDVSTDTTIGASVVVNDVVIEEYILEVTTDYNFLFNVVKDFDYPIFELVITPDSTINYSLLAHKYNFM